ncbi:MAG TPA: response regulator [Opitutaceae bacterium]|nr:response regulator [Opitutaceae bacterium]
MNNRVILIAEDNPNDVELTLSALRAHHVANDIVIVSDGAEALDYLYERGRFAGRVPGLPAVVLLDLKMPKVDGLEVLQTVKKDERMRRVPVVMLTSSREEQDLARSYDFGANSYVLKPVGFHAFVDAVKHLGVYWTVHNEAPPAS